MEQIYNTADLIGLEDKNIKINFVWKHQTHIEIGNITKLDKISKICLKYPYTFSNYQQKSPL